MAIVGKDPQTCYGRVRGGGFCSEASAVVFAAGPDGLGACRKHVGQVCLAAMTPERHGVPTMEATVVPADQWAAYAEREGW